MCMMKGGETMTSSWKMVCTHTDGTTEVFMWSGMLRIDMEIVKTCILQNDPSVVKVEYTCID